MNFLDGPLHPFQTIKDRKLLVGKTIRYLRHVDIDRSGRGAFFPRVDRVVEAKGLYLIFDGGGFVCRSDLKELQTVGTVSKDQEK